MNTIDLTKKKVEKFGGISGLRNILSFAPSSPDAVYYVHKVSRITGHIGFFTNKFIVGVDNPADCCKIKDIRDYVRDFHKTKVL